MEENAATKKKQGRADTGQQIIRACDMCRKKKIRCEPTGQACAQCIKSKAHCHFTPIGTKRKPRKPAGYKHIDELEKRLKRMETLLEAAGKGRQVENKAEMGLRDSLRVTDLEQTEMIDSAEVFGGPSSTEPALTRYSGSPAQSVPHSYYPMSFLSIPTRFPGSAGHLNNEGDAYTRSLSASLFSAPHTNYNLVGDLFSHHAFYKLPPKATALILIDEVFRSFNGTFPIFEQESFMRLVQERYSETDRGDLAWWACLNVIFALAHRFRAMRSFERKPEDDQASAYVQNALAVVSELIMLQSTLFSVQALLGLTIILQGTPNHQVCSMLIAATIRLAQGMGLHRNEYDPTLSEVEIEQRRRVFWIAYFVDKDISLRTGRPPSQDDDDMDVCLPSETLADLMIQRNSDYDINFFKFRIGLAIIQGQTYKRLYSVKAMSQSDTQRLLVAQELGAMLESWRSSLPIDLLEDYTNTTLHSPVPPAAIHRIILRFTYMNCLLSIYRPFRDLNSVSGTPIGPNLGFQDPNFPSETVCITEARNSVRLIQVTPPGDYAWVWILIHFFFAAVLTLLHNVLRNPSSFNARSDLRLVEPLLQLLERLSREGSSEDVQRMHELCDDLNRRAKEAVNRVNVSMICEKSKASGEKESVEEFIRRIECMSANCDTGGEFEPLAESVADAQQWIG